jgi:hypothetical protein
MNKTKKCECGRTVTLYGYDEECSCGRAYNAFGQRLGPRMLWSDDGDGFYGMNEGEEYSSPPPERLDLFQRLYERREHDQQRNPSNQQ